MTIRLTNPEDDRYERLRLIQWWDQEKLSKARVLVIGAGALGNEVCKNLALLGAGRVFVVDFDRIETTNLTRSALFRQTDVGRNKSEVLADRAGEINPDCHLESIKADARFDLGLGFLSELDLVIGCVDNREARYYMNRNCFLLRKLFIDGGLDTLNGAVGVFRPPKTACYECTLTTVDRAELQKRISCLKSTEPEIQNHVPIAPTIASIIGGLQTQIAIRAIHGLDIPEGKRIGMYGLSDLFFDINLEISDDCGLHAGTDVLPDSFESLEVRETDSLARIFNAAREKWNAAAISWDFDRDLIVSLTCTSCGKKQEFLGTGSQYQGTMQCSCGGAWKPEICGHFSGSESWGDRTLRELGFPADHVYAAILQDGRKFFRLRT